MAKSKLKFGTKYRYKYKPNEHSCHVCKKGIKKDLQLHHGKKKSQGGKSTKPIHAKCHAKTHGNYNYILTPADRRKAGLKTYRTNLLNQPSVKSFKVSVKGGRSNAYINSKASQGQTEKVGPTYRPGIQQRVESR